MKFNKPAVVALVTGVLCNPSVLAQEWSGEGDLGYSRSSGNSNNETLRAKLALKRTKDRWTHGAELEAVNSSSDDERTAEYYVGRWETEYALDDRWYLVGNLRYEDNRFSGYEYQASGTGGIGYHLIMTERTQLDLEGGFGYRRSEEQDTGETLDELVAMGEINYRVTLTDTTSLGWDVLTLAGADNTYVESDTGVRFRINSALALRLSHIIKHNTDVPAGTKNTDRLTGVSLVYSF